MRLRRWLDSHEVERIGRFGPGQALVAVAVVYLIGFGLPVFAAVRAVVLAHGGAHFRTVPGWTWRVSLELGLQAVAVVVAVPLLRREAPTWTRPVRPGMRWVSELRAFGLGLTAIFAGSTALKLLGWLPHPHLENSWSGGPGLVAVLLAGPAEEVVVLVLPVVFMRAAKWPWWAVITAMLALRLAYHVYYGFPVIGFSVWAVAMIFIYLRAHAVIGLIVAHSYWDLIAMFGGRWPAVAAALFSVTALSLLVWGIVSVILWVANRAVRRAENRPVVPLPLGWYQNNSGLWWWWDGQRWLPPAAPTAEPGTPASPG